MDCSRTDPVIELAKLRKKEEGCIFDPKRGRKGEWHIFEYFCIFQYILAYFDHFWHTFDINVKVLSLLKGEHGRFKEGAN